MPRTTSSADKTKPAGRRIPLGARITQRMRTELEAAARISGKSLSQEAEARLESSLALQDHLVRTWGLDFFLMVQSMAQAFGHAERHINEQWADRPEPDDDLFALTAAQVVRNYIALKRRYAQTGMLISTDDRSPEELARTFAGLGVLSSPPTPKREG